MVNLLTALMRRDGARAGTIIPTLTSVDDYAAIMGQVQAYGAMYPGGVQQTAGGLTIDPISTNFVGLAAAHNINPVVFSCMAVRSLVFSAVRFRYQRLRDGKPSDTFGTPDLGLLEEPWVGGTTQDLLSRTIQDADLAGNSYWTVVREQGRRDLVRLRPDWVDVVVEERRVRGALLGYRKAGYLYTEGGPTSGNEPVPLLLDEVAHFMPLPDPMATYRGMSWLTPVVREVQADGLMTKHKGKFFENGATPNMIIKHDVAATMEKVQRFQAWMDENHAGTDNAYRTLNLYPGADATVVGANFQQIDFRAVQGAGETRIAAAAGVPPVIVGLSEGLAAATYSNYGQARRRLADGTIHPLWQNVAGTFGTLVARQTGARLWYDASGVPFLREDEGDAATIAETKARTIRTYVDGGYTPESAVAAVEAGDLRLLVHTGLFSVQLQEPGAGQPSPGDNSSPVPTDQPAQADPATTGSNA